MDHQVVAGIWAYLCQRKVHFSSDTKLRKIIEGTQSGQIRSFLEGRTWSARAREYWKGKVWWLLHPSPSQSGAGRGSV